MTSRGSLGYFLLTLLAWFGIAKKQALQGLWQADWLLEVGFTADRSRVSVAGFGLLFGLLLGIGAWRLVFKSCDGVSMSRDIRS
jgi:hypothetical protein